MTVSRRLSLLWGLCFSGVGSAVAAPDSSAGDNVAIVEGVPVTRALLHRTLEGVYGEQVLPQLIDTQLLANALAQRGQSISEKEIDVELARLQVQDPTIKTALETGGARSEVIRNQVRRNLTVQKILTVRIPTPTQAQLQAFFTTYSSYYGTPAQNKIGFLATSTRARADELERALKSKPNSFEALVSEQKSKPTTDPIGGQSTSDVGHFESPAEFGSSRGISPQIAEPIITALATAKKGKVLPAQALTPTGPFLIVKVIDRKEAIKPNFATLRTEIETDYKMAQVAQNELKKNPSNSQKLEDSLKVVGEIMAQPNPQTGESNAKPSFRDMLTFILRPAGNKSLEYLRANAKLTISDSSFGVLASQYGKKP